MPQRRISDEVPLTAKVVNNAIGDSIADLIVSGSAATFSSVTVSALTSGRVVIAGAAGLLADDADLTFATDTLTATKFAGALNGTVGATTPSTGAFTTLTASTSEQTPTIRLTGFSGNANQGLINFEASGTTDYIFYNANSLAFRLSSSDRMNLTTTGLVITGTVSASNLSGTNTGDQTLPTRASLGLATSDNVVFNTVDVGTGGYKVSGTKVVGAQAAAEADIALGTSLTGADTVDKTAIESNFTDLNTKINSLLAKLRTHGLLAT